MEFLKKLYNEELPFSKRSMEIVKDILSAEQYGKAVMKFKTGTGLSSDHFIAWLVGYVENADAVYVFAFNIDGKDFDDASNLRNSIPREIMKEMGIL